MPEEQDQKNQQTQSQPNQTDESVGLKSTTSAFMIIVAVFFDLIQALINLIPVAGQILSFLVSVFAFLTFYVWFKINGISFAKPKRAGKLAGGFIIEAIPIINILPAWTLAVVLIIGETKIKKIIAQVPGGNKIASIVSVGKKNT